MSVNACWQGRRFKTPAYKTFEKEMLSRMRKEKMPPKPYSVLLTFGFSNNASDIDNPIKPTLDIIQKKFGINDKDITELHVAKRLVGKGDEFIEYSIYHFSL
mgnify:CR=1 FL=1